jgi:hypothetical protein
MTEPRSDRESDEMTNATTTTEELEERVVELERRVKNLENRDSDKRYGPQSGQGA